MRFVATLIAGAVLAACTAEPQRPADGSLIADSRRGALLYGTACSQCHTTQAHWRDRHVVRNWPELLGQVERWQRIAGQNWREPEINDVAAHLNRLFYKLPCPAEGCGAPQ